MAEILRPREPSLEEVSPIAARQRHEAKRQLPIDILLTLVSGGASSLTSKQASRSIVRQALDKLAPMYGRKEALRRARTSLRGVAITPEEYLKPFRSIKYKDLPPGTRGQFVELAKRSDPEKVIARETWLNVVDEPSIGTIPHEMGVHYPQYVPQSSRLKTLLKPLSAEDVAAKASGKMGTGYKSLIEKHAREATRRMVVEAKKGGKGGRPRRLTKEQADRIFEASLKAVLESEGWVP